MVLKGCPETSGKNYLSTVRKIPQQCRSQNHTILMLCWKEKRSLKFCCSLFTVRLCQAFLRRMII